MFQRSLPRVLKEGERGVWRRSDRAGIRRRSSDAHQGSVGPRAAVVGREVEAKQLKTG